MFEDFKRSSTLCDKDNTTLKRKGLLEMSLKKKQIEMIKTSWKTIKRIFSSKSVVLFSIWLISYTIAFFLFNLELIPNPPIQKEQFVELSYRFIEVLGIMIVILIPLCVYCVQRMSADWKDVIALYLRANDEILSENRRFTAEMGINVYSVIEPAIQEFQERIEYVNGYAAERHESVMNFFVKILILTSLAILLIVLGITKSFINPIMELSDLTITIFSFILGLFVIFSFLFDIVVTLSKNSEFHSNGVMEYFFDSENVHQKILERINELREENEESLKD